MLDDPRRPSASTVRGGGVHPSISGVAAVIEAGTDGMAARPARTAREDRAPSASPGEREAAEWIVAEFEALGADARIETEAAHGTVLVAARDRYRGGIGRRVTLLAGGRKKSVSKAAPCRHESGRALRLPAAGSSPERSAWPGLPRSPATSRRTSARSGGFCRKTRPATSSANWVIRTPSARSYWSPTTTPLMPD